MSAMSMGRRRMAAVAITGVMAVAGGAAASASAATVDMERLLLAAQLDPPKDGNGLTAGAGPSVLEVERALAGSGLLERRYVDGHYGTTTITAYKNWQRKLGYSGRSVNGIPGRASLSKLAKGRFTVTREIRLGGVRSWKGFRFNGRTVAMLEEAQRLSGVSFIVEQGSYSPGVDPTSKGTHDGGGTADLDAEALSPRQRDAALRALRRVGFAAWLRTPDQDNWPLHFHVTAISDTDLSDPAQPQIARYYTGRNGLASNGPDDGPKVRKQPWESYKRSR